MTQLQSTEENTLGIRKSLKPSFSEYRKLYYAFQAFSMISISVKQPLFMSCLSLF